MQKRCLQCDGVEAVELLEVWVRPHRRHSTMFLLLVCRPCRKILEAMLEAAALGKSGELFTQAELPDSLRRQRR